MAKRRLSVEKVKTETVKPLFAAAGVTEVAVQRVVEAAGDAQARTATQIDKIKSVSTSVSRSDLAPDALQEQAVTLVATRVDELTKDARALQARFEEIVADLRKDAASYPKTVRLQVETAIADATETYGDLADRGERFVEAIRKDGVKAVSVLSKKKDQVTEAAEEAVEKVVSEAASVVKKTSTKKPAAKKAPAKKPAAKEAPAKKAPAKKAAAKKAPAKKAAAKKSTAKKAPAKKAAAKKSTAKKAPAKKAAK